MRKQIGWYNLKNDTEYTNTFECAAWYERILVKAGRYPVEVIDYTEKHLDDGTQVYGHCNGVYVSLPGTVISEYFGAQFYGMPVSDYDSTKNAGQKAQHSMFGYMYSVAESILQDPDTSWELFPEYEARKIVFSSLVDEKILTTHGIFKK